MSLSVDVVWDGSVFRPETPPDLPINSRHTLPIQPPNAEDTTRKPLSALEVLRNAKLECPPDFSTRWEEYLNDDFAARG